MTVTRPVAGVVGLGRIGAGVARCTAGGGFQTVVFDVDSGRLRGLGGAAQIADSNRELAQSADVVFIAVFDEQQMREALVGPDGLLTAEPAPGAIVILSTVPIDAIHWAASACGEHGVGVLDCGVAGGKGLENGSIVAMVGGDSQTFAFARPVLETFASPLAHMGALGTGMQAKLARNLLHYCLALVASEGGRLAAAAGIDGATFVELFRARDEIGPGFYDFLDAASQASGDNGGLSPQTIAPYAIKDLQAALQLSSEFGLDLPVAASVLDVFGRMSG